MHTNNVWTGIARGLRRTCPTCGRGALFRGFLTVRPRCPDCGADNSIYPSDDLPPYATILIVGHLIVPAFFYVDRAFEPAIWLECAIWLPLTTLLTLALLPIVKGAAIGLCWATGTVQPRLGGRREEQAVR